MTRLNRLRAGFRGKKQLPLFMLWIEYLDSHTGNLDDNVEFARVIFNSMNWIGI